jgi:hypothetical protein
MERVATIPATELNTTMFIRNTSLSKLNAHEVSPLYNASSYMQ